MQRSLVSGTPGDLFKKMPIVENNFEELPKRDS